VGITAASAEPRKSARRWKRDFGSAGFDNVMFPHCDRTDASADRRLAAKIESASGVFLGGGNQVKLVSELSGTRAEEAIKALHAQGGVICGTSAGAAALTTLTMAGGELDEEGQLVEQYIGPGFGLLGYQTIVDTHFSARRRLHRLFVVIAANPSLFGLGIDEDTALVVRDGIGEVVGAGGVTFVDGRSTVRFDNAQDLDHGRQLTLSHLRVGIVGTHYTIDLECRDLEMLTRPQPSST
jgi:cyanophycinase